MFDLELLRVVRLKGEFAKRAGVKNKRIRFALPICLRQKKTKIDELRKLN